MLLKKALLRLRQYGAYDLLDSSRDLKGLGENINPLRSNFYTFDLWFVFSFHAYAGYKQKVAFNPVFLSI